MKKQNKNKQKKRLNKGIKFLIELVCMGAVTALALSLFNFAALAQSAPLVPIPGGEHYGDVPKLQTTDPVGMLNEIVGGLIKNVKWIVGALAVMYLIISAVMLVIKGDQEDAVSKQKNNVIYAIVGLIVISLASEIGRVFQVACQPGDPNCIEGGFLKNPETIIRSTDLFNQNVMIVITFIKYLIGGVALAMFIRNGIRMVVIGGNEEKVSIDKKNLVWTAIALGVLIISSTAIDKVFYIVDRGQYLSEGYVQPKINPQAGVEEIVGLTNIMVSIAGPLAILALIIGGLMYAFSGGNEDTQTKAKRVIIFAIVGLVLIYGAFAIISTVINSSFQS
jgi:hypothetical protein